VTFSRFKCVPGDGEDPVGLKETLAIREVAQCVAKCGRLSGEAVSMMEGGIRCGGTITYGAIG